MAFNRRVVLPLTIWHVLLILAGMLLCANSIWIASKGLCRHEGRWLPFKAGLVLATFAAVDSLSFLPGLAHTVLRVMMLISLTMAILLSGYIMSGWIKKDNRSKSCKQAVVLGAGLCNGQLTRTLQLRMDQSLFYLGQCDDSMLYISGGLDEGETETEASVMASYLKGEGIQPQRLRLEEHSGNTVENFKNIHALGAAGQIVVITSGYHMKRALRCARLAGFHPVALPAKIHKITFISEMARECGAILLFYMIEIQKKREAKKQR
ncbi:MAG: YdcF family protein [Christensenellales bacterium]